LQTTWGSQEGGLVIIGVPSNDFGNQEPGEAAAISVFCERNYGVTFAMMEKTHVKGAEAHPLFRWLGEQAGFLGKPRWNFYKYLTRRDGTLAAWFSSKTAPDSPKLQRAIEAVV
jgi:glutathione peroxidase